MYSLDPNAPAAAVERLRASFLDCGRFIPEVLHSAIGTNLSDAPVQLVWEHAYDSPEAYQRYMVHPFHACILDRYLLADSAERIVTSNDLAAGLVGYACDSPVYHLERGVRRLVLLALGSDGADLEKAVQEAADGTPGLAVSVVATNSMASAWFDGVTPVTGPPVWSHVWEQGWDSLDALDAYRDSGSPLAAAERSGWAGWMDGLVSRAASVHYELVTPASG
jgi:hypothetical protein